MSLRSAQSSPATYARAAGVAYLVIIVAGILAEFVIRGNLIVRGDAGATAMNITGSPLLFRSSLVSEFVMLCCDVFVALALFVVFREVDRSLALLAAFFRLVHAAIVGVNLLNTYIPLLLLGDAAHLEVLGTAQRHALALTFLDAHAYGYAVGLVFFGVQCWVMARLILKAEFVPNVLGWLLLVAGAGYLVDSVGRTILMDYAAYENVFGAIVLAPALIGELAFCGWLLVRGGRVPGSAAGMQTA